MLLFIYVPDTQTVRAVADDCGCLGVGADRGKLMEEESAEEFGDEVFHKDNPFCECRLHSSGHVRLQILHTTVPVSKARFSSSVYFQ